MFEAKASEPGNRLPHVRKPQAANVTGPSPPRLLDFGHAMLDFRLRLRIVGRAGEGPVPSNIIQIPKHKLNVW